MRAAADDPDRNKLTYRWFHYPEAGFVPGANMADVEIAKAETSQALVKVTSVCRPDWLHTNNNCNKGIAHIILAVTDDGVPGAHVVPTCRAEGAARSSPEVGLLPK
jgi:hypothetical protein